MHTRPKQPLLRLFLVCSIAISTAFAARAQALEPLPVNEVSPGNYVAVGRVETASPKNQGHIANIGFIVGEKTVAVIDTGGSRLVGERLRAAIRARTDLPIRYVINTHMHPDHVLGNAAFKIDQPTFLGHPKLPRALAARAATYLPANAAIIGEENFRGTEIIAPAPDSDNIEQIDLGDRLLKLMTFPTAHTDNDLVVIDTRTNTAWLGDLVFAEHLPVIDGSLNGWLKALTRLAQDRFAIAIPGHGKPSSDWPALVQPQINYLSGLRARIRQFIAEGKSISDAIREIEPPKENQWQLAADFHRRNISAAFSELEWE